VHQDDGEAIEAAKQLINGYDVELWQQERRVALFESPKRPSPC
jgi:hypothetical protein